MALESGTYLADLNAANPPGTDPKAQGDDHIRLIKAVARNSFAGFSGAVVVTGAEAQGTTASDYVVTVAPAPAAYSTSMLVVFKATHANTGAATLKINALAAKTLKAVDGSALESGDIENGAVVGAFYDGTDFFLVTANDRAARAGDSYTGTHDFTAATAVQAPTQSAGDNSSKVATTAYVDAADALKAPLASPALTGVPTAPTASPGTNTTQVATTAFATQLAFQAALPVQGGSPNPSFLFTDGTSAEWGYTIASQAEAQAGVASNRLMTAQRTADAVAQLTSQGPIFFGDGSDGSVTISSSVTLSRDMFYDNLTIAAGGTLNTNGWRIFVRNTLDLTAAPAGGIQFNGNAGSAGLAGTGGNGGAALNPNSIGGAGAGANGSTPNPLITPGSPATASSATGQNGGAGGGGGVGGSGQGGGQAGGTSGSSTAITASLVHLARTTLAATEFTITPAVGGNGGGGGASAGGDSASGTNGGAGGGGGGGGGVIGIWAKIIIRGVSTAAGAIGAKGGAGGNGESLTITNGGGGGGGSGGGGGWIYLVCQYLTGLTAANGLDVTGGDGAKGGNGSGSGKGGGAGGTGVGGRITIVTLSTQSYVESKGAAINAPTAAGATSTGVAAQTATAFRADL